MCAFDTARLLKLSLFGIVLLIFFQKTGAYSNNHHTKRPATASWTRLHRFDVTRQIFWSATTLQGNPKQERHSHRRNSLMHSSLLSVPQSRNDDSGGYVPSGLTPQEYQKLKQKEAREQASKDFGAWGPRFHRSNRPDGDWFLMKSLWTGGFDPNNGNNQGAGDNLTRRKQLQKFLSRFLPPFLLAFAAIDCVLSALSVWTAAQMTVRKAVQLSFTVLFRRQLLVTLYWNMMLLKLVASIGFTAPADEYMEWASRKLQWSHKRVWFSTVAAMLGSVILWSVLLAAARNLRF